MDDANYVAHMFEEMRDQLRGINEGVTAVREGLARVPKREEFDELKQDVKVIKVTVTATNHDLKQHKSLPAHMAHGHA